MPAVDRVVRRRRAAAFATTNEETKPAMKRRRTEFPEPGAIDQIFREAKRNRA